MSTTTLASLALLKANIETEGRDVLDMITPLVEFVGSKSGLKSGFSSADLKAATIKELGLDLPERAVDLILRRMQRRGLATCDSGLYSVGAWSVDPTSFEDTRSQLLRRSADIVEGLRSFISERHQVSWSSDEARDALDGYVDLYSIDCIRAHAAASPVPVHGRSPSNAQYLVQMSRRCRHAWLIWRRGIHEGLAFRVTINAEPEKPRGEFAKCSRAFRNIGGLSIRDRGRVPCVSYA